MIAFLVPAWNDALLFVEREGKETPGVGLWPSRDGVPEATAALHGLAGVASAIDGMWDAERRLLDPSLALPALAGILPHLTAPRSEIWE